MENIIFGKKFNKIREIQGFREEKPKLIDICNKKKDFE